MNGTRLGGAKNDPALVASEKQIALEDQRKQNDVEGKICQARQRFGLGLIREKLVETSGCSIAVNFLVMNLEKLLELLIILFAIVLGVLIGIRGSVSCSKVFEFVNLDAAMT